MIRWLPIVRIAAYVLGAWLAATCMADEATCAYCPSYPCTASNACGDCSCVKGPNELVGECLDINP